MHLAGANLDAVELRVRPFESDDLMKTETVEYSANRLIGKSRAATTSRLSGGYCCNNEQAFRQVLL